ncbi:MAG: S8 family serine peptidase [Candidatus Bipolaricaulota bacterium]|nr:S8 family serine peptidase [Candidatus Bipolaricaulota bacterium]
MTRLHSDFWALLGSVFVAVILLLSVISSSSTPPPAPPQHGEESFSEDPYTKLDPFLRLLAQRAQREPHFDVARFAPLAAVYTDPSPTQGGEQKIGVLIKITSSLPYLPGVSINSLTRDLVSARVTLNQLRELAQLSQVVFIEADYRLEPHIDKSVPAVGGRFLHEANPRATGQGVIVGFVDTGIDWSHPDFRTDRDGDGFEESSRIVWVWDQTETGFFGSPRKVPFGTEYTREEIELALRTNAHIVNERDGSGHGTHTIGIAVGDGSASGGTYVGMAPQAEMIVVKTSYFSTDIVEGVRYVFEKASWLGKPAVVNLSLGGHFGPHDGTSLFEQSLEAFLEQPGRALVASAGNDGDQRIHVGEYLRARASFTFTFVPNEETAYVNIWYPGAANFTVAVTSPGINGPPQTVLALRGQGEFQNTPDGSVQIDNAGGGLDPRNRDRAIAISLEKVQPGSRWSITLTDQGGTGGRFDAWPGLSTMGYFPEGDSLSTVTEPATAKKIIAVGAYTTKVSWQGADGEPHRFTDAQSEGQLARFSARGPTRDGRLKPDLTAPGTAIVSALAKDSEISRSEKLVLPGRAYAAMQGTSMAAPHVAGAVALLLQAQPDLRADEILAQLQRTALQDAFTASGPTTAWGAGKLQADRGFETLGLHEQLSASRPALKVGPNPASPSQSVTFFYSVATTPRTVELKVFDLVGRPVYSAVLSPHSQRFQWALRDDRGEPLPPGLYIAIVIANGRPSAPHPLIVRR